LGSTNNNLNAIRSYAKNDVSGESGSPVLNLDGEVVSIITGSLTEIVIVLEQ